MRIAINALGVDGGGGQTYIENLVPQLERLDQITDYYLLFRKRNSIRVTTTSNRIHVIEIPIPHPSLVWRFLIEQLFLPLWLIRKKIDLLYSPADSTTLLAKCPVVLAMRNPNLYAKQDLRWSLRYRLKFAILSRMARLSAAKAKQVIFVSAASKDLVGTTIEIPKDKLNVIHHGVSRFFFKESNIPRDLGILHDRMPYILSVSSIYRYKNYVRLIEAFSKVRIKLPENYHLIIIGSSFDNPYYSEMVKAINLLGLARHVHCLGGLPLEQLPPFYHHATLFAFPSFLETFGHTLVEAMAAEIPIIAANISSTREVTNEAAIYFDPFDTNAIADAIYEGITNLSRREKLIADGRKQVEKFSWEHCAEETIKTFMKATISLASAEQGHRC